MTGFKGVKLDGMVGLAPGIRSTVKEGFVQDLYNQRTIRKNMFSLHIGDESFISFGGFDHSFLRTLKGNSNLSDEQIEDKI